MIYLYGSSHTFSGSNWAMISEVKCLLRKLVGGLEHDCYFPIQLGMSSSQLTFIFFRGIETTNQWKVRVYSSKTMISSIKDVFFECFWTNNIDFDPEIDLTPRQAGHMAVVRTTQSGERLQPLAQVELVKGQPNKGAARWSSHTWSFPYKVVPNIVSTVGL